MSELMLHLLWSYSVGFVLGGFLVALPLLAIHWMKRTASVSSDIRDAL